MTALKKIPLIISCCTMLWACGSSEEPTGVIPEGHKKAIEKAEGVEDLLKDAEAKAMQGLDEDS